MEKHETEAIEVNTTKIKDFTSKAVENISKSSPKKQLIIGTVSGWTTGYITMKVGKTAAFALGGGIILIQIANHKGYIKMDWDKVKETAQQTTKKFEGQCNGNGWMPRIMDFTSKNACFAAGFVGGFLIGLAS